LRRLSPHLMATQAAASRIGMQLRKPAAAAEEAAACCGTPFRVQTGAML
jgi:hypothetical protein